MLTDRDMGGNMTSSNQRLGVRSLPVIIVVCY